MAHAPTAPGKRQFQLDVLRGLALFGVLLENLQHFVVPSYATYAAGPAATVFDHAALGAVRALCDNKVYAIFAFLFGYGIALQMKRVDTDFVGLQIWRMAILFLIGLAHSLLWDGDILTTYALLGLLLIPLRNQSDSFFGSVTLAGLVAPSLVLLGLLAWADTLELAARDSVAESVAEHTYALRQTSFAFGAIALGLAAGRHGAFSDPARFVALTRRALLPAVLVGVGCNLGAVVLLHEPGQGNLSLQGVFLELLLAVGTPALAFVYIHIGLALCTREPWITRLQPIADIGRTSLTNYLLQSVIGVCVLARTGLGPLGPITPPAGIALAVALFAAQAAASRWWLARFRFGPVEWAWRAATYATLPPMRVGSSER